MVTSASGIAAGKFSVAVWLTDFLLSVYPDIVAHSVCMKIGVIMLDAGNQTF